MTPKTFIEKAIEGGWKQEDFHKRAYGVTDQHVVLEGGVLNGKIKNDKYIYFRDIILDPLAWQAVGKAGGWEVIHDSDCDSFNDYCTHHGECDCEQCDCGALYEYRHKMHAMIDALVEGRSLESFLETL